MQDLTHVHVWLWINAEMPPSRHFIRSTARQLMLPSATSYLPVCRLCPVLQVLQRSATEPLPKCLQSIAAPDIFRRYPALHLPRPLHMFVEFPRLHGMQPKIPITRSHAWNAVVTLGEVHGNCGMFCGTCLSLPLIAPA